MHKSVCSCGRPQMWANDPNFPLYHDSKMEEYFIRDASNRRFMISYCPSCGGKLPQSRRDSFFTIPDQAEVSDMRKIMSRIKNVDQMRGILGEPDEAYQWTMPKEFHDFYNVEKWKMQFTYSNRWATLTLCVYQHDDDSISYDWSGKEASSQNDDDASI